MRTKAIVVSLLTALLLLPATGSAQNKKEEFMKKKMAKMGITEEQGTKLKELYQEMRTSQKKHIAKMKELRKKTKQELLKDNPSRSALSAYSDEMGNLYRKKNENRINHLLKVKTILTPEQFEKMADHGFRKKSRMRGHGGKRRGKGCKRGAGMPGMKEGLVE